MYGHGISRIANRRFSLGTHAGNFEETPWLARAPTRMEAA